jgi:hypothetical protein
MYLNEDKRTHVLDAIAPSMAEDGLLMLGAAETVIGQTQKFKASRNFAVLRVGAEPEKRVASKSFPHRLILRATSTYLWSAYDHDLEPIAQFWRAHLPITMLVLHYTGMQSGAAAIDWLANPASKVSAHYVVDEDGQLVHMVREEQSGATCRAFLLARCHGLQ